MDYTSTTLESIGDLSFGQPQFPGHRDLVQRHIPSSCIRSARTTIKEIGWVIDLKSQGATC